MALTNVVDFYSTPASAKTGMRSRYVTQSNGVVVRKSSIRKLPNSAGYSEIEQPIRAREKHYPLF